MVARVTRAARWLGAGQAHRSPFRIMIRAVPQGHLGAALYIDGIGNLDFAGVEMFALYRLRCELPTLRAVDVRFAGYFP